MAVKWDKARKKAVLERMMVIRRFEEDLVDLFEAKEFDAHFHLYIGQEATGTAIMQVLGRKDKLASTHRNHGHVIGRGADPGAAMAEILARKTGLCGGAGGTLHLGDPDLGFIYTSSIVGGCISLATGAAFALKQQGGDAVSVAFFGDGSLEEGISLEAMNFAALWKLPIVFVCENNSKGALGSIKGGFPTQVSAVKDIARVPHLFDMPTYAVDGRDPQAVLKVAEKAVTHARKRRGPAFILAVTERWAGSKPLWPSNPTGATDITMAWDDSRIKGRHADCYRNHDPILLLSRQMLKSRDITRDELVALDRKVRRRMDKAKDFAVKSPMPAAKNTFDNVFA